MPAHLSLAALAVALVIAGCGPRPVMRVTGDRTPDASETTGGGAPPPSRSARSAGPRSTRAPADPGMDQTDASGNVHDPEDGDRTDDMDRGDDYPD